LSEPILVLIWNHIRSTVDHHSPQLEQVLTQPVRVT